MAQHGWWKKIPCWVCLRLSLAFPFPACSSSSQLHLPTWVLIARIPNPLFGSFFPFLMHLSSLRVVMCLGKASLTPPWLCVAADCLGWVRYLPLTSPPLYPLHLCTLAFFFFFFQLSHSETSWKFAPGGSPPACALGVAPWSPPPLAGMVQTQQVWAHSHLLAPNQVAPNSKY